MSMAPSRSHLRRRLIQGGLALTSLGLLAGCGVVAAPWQRPTGIPVVGLLSLGLDAQREEYIEALKHSLRDLGHVEGRTLTIETRHADGDVSRLPALAAELVAG